MSEPLAIAKQLAQAQGLKVIADIDPDTKQPIFYCYKGIDDWNLKKISLEDAHFLIRISRLAIKGAIAAAAISIVIAFVAFVLYEEPRNITGALLMAMFVGCGIFIVAFLVATFGARIYGWSIYLARRPIQGLRTVPQVAAVVQTLENSPEAQKERKHALSTLVGSLLSFLAVIVSLVLGFSPEATHHLSRLIEGLAHFLRH